MGARVRPNFRRLNISESSDKPSNISFYPLRMTADRRTEMYVKFAKVLLIFQGAVTDERREAVSELSSKFKYAGRLISEETYKKETVVCSDEGDLDDFFSYFKNRLRRSCEEGYNLIVIDQSITNPLQLKYFCHLAHTMQYVILLYPPIVDPAQSDKHRTKAETFTGFSGRKVLRHSYFKHLFCGWFLHDVDSVEMRGEASLYIQDCFDNIPEFREMFTTICKSCDFREYYNMIDKRQELAYSTMKIFRNPLDMNAYMSSDMFKKFYGAMSRLYVIGFLISPHVIAARIKLTHDQRKLWEMPDELDERSKSLVFPSELIKTTRENSKVPVEDVKLIASKCNRTIIRGDPIQAPTEIFHPNARGRACHVALGKANDAPFLSVDYDVPFAVFRERNVVQKYSDEVRPYDLDRCLVRRIGKYWFIYLKETLIVNGLFASYCALEE